MPLAIGHGPGGGPGTRAATRAFLRGTQEREAQSLAASIDRRFNGLGAGPQGDAVGWFVVPRWGGVDEATRCWGGCVNRSVGSLRGIGLAAEAADWRPG